MKKLHVYDTYATCSDGRIMHFDVIIDTLDQGQALKAAKSWLTSIGEGDAAVKSHSCMFCHSVEESASLSGMISQSGYAIYKLEGCPA